MNHIKNDVKGYIIVAAVFIALAGFLLWNALYIPPEVTDAEARNFVEEVDARSLEAPQNSCDYALLTKSCVKRMSKDSATPLLKKSTVVCTWPLAGRNETRVAEIENVGPDGKPYRSSLAVSRDGKTLKAEPLPYWELSIRDVPAADAPPPEALPDDMFVPTRFDPCKHSDSTN
ncbi:hypothetical protein [Timonella sp. A28]|uniref:hypothetical protein n=1 Tax=Timonella sp. A28 TaxID=3442640 RepID=UPI003EB7EC2F